MSAFKIGSFQRWAREEYRRPARTEIPKKIRTGGEDCSSPPDSDNFKLFCLLFSG
jgi:hypothetical protein